MTRPNEIEALQRLDGPIAPSKDADERIRRLIEDAIGSEGATDSAETTRLRHNETGATDITRDLPRAHRSSDRRWWRPEILLAAAAVMLIVGVIAAIGARRSDEARVVVATDAESPALSTAEQICTGAYADVAGQWREVLESADPGFVVTPSAEEAAGLVESHGALIDAVQRAVDDGALQLASTAPLDAARASVADSLATLSLEGTSSLVGSLGATHRHLTELVEQNPMLATYCDPTLIAWPE